jgi:hypothetical protein
MSNTQFEQMLAVLLGAVQASAATPPPVTPAPVVPSSRISWAQMPSLDLSHPGELDDWFIALEGRLRASLVPESHWAEKFMECSANFRRWTTH